MVAQSENKHIQELDGVRGLAILLVLFHHFLIFPPGLYSEALNFIGRLGWTGVDLFFVLSGFLISRILVAQRGQPSYFRNFYARRALRIFPIYYAYLFVYYVAVIKLGLLVSDASRTAESIEVFPWLLFYGTNFFIALKGTFIVASLNQLWTLSIEEHFYLIWPWVVKKLDAHKLFLACGGVIILAITTRCLLLLNNVSGFTIHTFTICRIDDFAIGAMGALLLLEKQKTEIFRYLNIIFYSLFGLIVAASFLLQTVEAGNPWVQSVGYTILGFFFLGLILKVVLGPPNSTLRSFFGRQWIRSLGKYSYALYIFQMPILVAVKRLLPGSAVGKLMGDSIQLAMATSAIGLTLSIILAVASYHLFEKWFLKLKVHF